MKEFVVYALCHPDTLEIMYVGQTTRPHLRLLEHIKRAKIETTMLYRWISSLEGRRPVFKELERVTGHEELNKAEVKWIAELRPSKNHTSGGDNFNWMVPKKTVYNYDVKSIKEQLDSGATIQELANHIGCSKAAIRKHLKSHLGLNTKNAKNCRPDGSFTAIESRRCISEPELRDLYLNKELSCNDIARLKGCSSQAIKIWLRKWHIPVRSASESKKAAYRQGKKFGFQPGNKGGL